MAHLTLTGVTASRSPRSLRLPRGRTLELKQRPLVMGVLNVTPDSFSDGGRWTDPSRAIDRSLEMVAEGAEIIDLGAESTRPAGKAYGEGARTVPIAEEWARLEPVLEAVRDRTATPISIDTRHGEVARRALDLGADMINDVTALRDPQLAATVAEHGCPVVLMHLRGDISDMKDRARYDDLTGEIATELRSAVDRAQRAGIDDSQIILDPGIGFAKNLEHNLVILKHLDRLADLGFPILVGASRKSFIGQLTGDPPDDRLAGSLAAAAWAAHHRAAIVRAHDVLETARFLQVWEAICQVVSS